MRVLWDIVTDPLHGDGYQFWSGIGAALVVPLGVGALVWLWPTRCQEIGCYRRARKRHALHGQPVCEKHL